MSCKKARDQVKKVLEEQIAELNTSDMSITVDGTSIEYAKAWYTALKDKVGNTQEIAQLLRERSESLSEAFHKVLVNETGEVLYLESEGRVQQHFLHSSKVHKEGKSGGLELAITVAPSTDVTQLKTYRFSLESESSLRDTIQSPTTVLGINVLFAQALKKNLEQTRAAQIKETKIESYGDKEVQGQLEAMNAADRATGRARGSLRPEDLIGYEIVRDYQHGNLDTMKEILNKLHVLGNRRTSPENMAFLNTLFDSFQTRFFNETKLFLKRQGLENAGRFDPINNRINIDIGGPEIQPLSAPEAYAAQVVKSMITWARMQKDKSTTNIDIQLNHAMDVAQKNTSWKHLLPISEEAASELDIQRAKDLYNRIFMEDGSVEEFVAYSLVHPQLREHLQGLDIKEKGKQKKNLIQKISELFHNLTNIVFGKFNFRDNETTVFEKVNNLAFALAEINGTHGAELKRMNPLGQMMGLLQDTDSAAARGIEKIAEYVKNNETRIADRPSNGNILSDAKFMLQFGVKAITNPVYRGAFGLWASVHGVKTNSFLREFARGFFERTPTFREAEQLMLQGTHIDVGRNSTIDSTARELKEAFKEELTPLESAAASSVYLGTNMTTLMFKNTNRGAKELGEIRKLLTNKHARAKAKRQLEKQIRRHIDDGEVRANWTIAQAKELGRFMATGEGTPATNLNAFNIARGFGLNIHYDLSRPLVDMLDDLAALEALEYTKNADRKRISMLIQAQPKAMQLLADTYRGFVQGSLEHVFNNDPTHMVTGYTKELFDSTIDVKVAPVSDAAKMRQQGYTLRTTLTNDYGLSSRVPLALYSTDSWGKAERLKGAVSLGVNKAKGSTLSQIKRIEYPDAPTMAHNAFKRDKDRALIQAIHIHEAMSNGTYRASDYKTSLVPVYDKTGDISDYRYTMAKDQKQDLLNQEMDVFQVMSRSAGDILYQHDQNAVNAAALDLVRRDMRDNWVQGELGEDNRTEYQLIGPEVHSDLGKQLYYLMPQEFRDHILSRQDKQIAVREEILQMLFGYEHLQFSDMPGINKLPQEFKKLIDTVEGMWMEFVKISKSAILLKLPWVIYQNIMSNMLYAISTGNVNPVELVKDYRETFNEIQEYISTNTEISDLRVDIRQSRAAAARVVNETGLQKSIEKKVERLDALLARQERHPLHELFESGIYQSYVQDVGRSTIRQSNRLTKGMQAKIDKAPAGVKQMAHIAYLTQETGWYKGMQELMQRSDMVARAVELRRERKKVDGYVNGKTHLPKWWRDHQKSQNGEEGPVKQVLRGDKEAEFRRMHEDVITQNARDNYINYVLPNTPREEWLNRMGVLMFTKYLKRVQPIIRNGLMQNPIKTSLMFLAATTGPFNLSTIQDSNLMLRSFDYQGDFNPLGMVSIYSPLYHANLVFIPPIIKSETYMGLLW